MHIIFFLPSALFKAKIKEAICGLQECTVMVSQLGLFSDNEIVEDLSAASLKFLLLPALLGFLTLKDCSFSRLETLDVAKVYFIDYLKRCKSYEVSSFEIPFAHEEDTVDDENSASVKNAKSQDGGKKQAVKEMEMMIMHRESKIKRFKEKKALIDCLNALEKSIKNDDSDDGTVKEYYLTMIKRYIYESFDELDSILMERTMLIKMAELKADGHTLEDDNLPPKQTPLRPFLLTRDAIQKEVFGMGYPSLPTMTVEEFYEQRVKEGVFPPQNKVNPSKAVQEEKPEVESDEEEFLESLRARDEWRDSHRRGWGNTYNRS